MFSEITVSLSGKSSFSFTATSPQLSGSIATIFLSEATASSNESDTLDTRPFSARKSAFPYFSPIEAGEAMYIRPEALTKKDASNIQATAAILPTQAPFMIASCGITPEALDTHFIILPYAEFALKPFLIVAPLLSKIPTTGAQFFIAAEYRFSIFLA